jgi:RNA polymerase sigma-70 factor (ECF subfamily)
VTNIDDIGLLIQACAKGDRRAFGRLYRQTGAKLHGIIRRIMPQNETAEEVLQESYVRIWQRAGTFDPQIASAMAWMASIARNQAIDARRRGAERISQASSSDDSLLSSIEAQGAGEGEQSLALIQLKRCLDQLEPERRELLLLAYYNGLSREELAQRAARPVATVKSALRRSLILLKECLDGRG